MTEVLATLSPSPFRRVGATAALAALGCVPLWMLVFRTPQTPVAQAVLLAVGLFVVFLAYRLWQSTAVSLVLTRDGLFDSTGRPLAPLDEIAKVDRGMLAIKPSNGFVVTTRRPLGRGWSPGLWWRVFSWIGVGGVVPAVQAKVMSDALTALLADRDGA